MTHVTLLWITGRERKDDDTLEFLQRLKQEADVRPVAEEELSAYLQQQPAETIAGTLITSSVEAPIAAARRVFRQLPGREVLFVTGGDQQASWERQINQAYLYGHHRLIDGTNGDDAVRVAKRLLRQAKKQRRYRSALSRINEQMARPRDEVAWKRRVAISDRLLASILAQSPDALFALDLDGYLLACNTAAARKFGMADREGRHFEETALAGALPQLKDLVRKSKESGQTCHQEMVFRPQEGEKGTIDLEASASPVLDEKEDLIGITVLLRDVTKLKTAERELRQLNAELEHRVADRTAELQSANDQMESFLYSAAHDLRNPIRTIRGFSEILKEEYSREMSGEAEDLLRRISEAAGRMDCLIGDLLAYGRVAKAELPTEAIDLNRVLATALDELKQEIGDRQARVRIEPSLGRVLAHQTTIEQAVINIVMNALRYSKPDEPPRIRVFSERRGESLRLSIEDNGQGIDSKYHDRIFRVFERVEGSPKSTRTPSTGVGLAIVKLGIERLGGRVGVESEPGRGSRFWVELPAAEALSR